MGLIQNGRLGGCRGLPGRQKPSRKHRAVGASEGIESSIHKSKLSRPDSQGNPRERVTGSRHIFAGDSRRACYQTKETAPGSRGLPHAALGRRRGIPDTNFVRAVGL